LKPYIFYFQLIFKFFISSFTKNKIGPSFHFNRYLYFKFLYVIFRNATLPKKPVKLVKNDQFHNRQICSLIFFFFANMRKTFFWPSFCYERVWLYSDTFVHQTPVWPQNSDRWLLFWGHFCHKITKFDPKMLVDGENDIVATWTWSLAQVWLYIVNTYINNIVKF